jgi:recombination protein RecR
MSGIYPKSLEEVSSLLCSLPGIGKRTADRMALSLLDWEESELIRLSNLIGSLKEKIRFCQICGNLAESRECAICSDPKRDHQLICVVETPRQISVINKCGRFNGVFHVLGGRLSPLDDIGVDSLNINQLLERIRENDVREVILSTSPDVEGEATAAYLAEELSRNFAIAISRIALGIPLGSDLMFADAATMGMAIDARRPIR